MTALGPRTAYTAEKWQQIAGFFELDAASEVVWIKPMIADWWLAGGGNVESLRNLVQGHRSARDFKRDYFDSVPPIYMEPIYGSE